MATTLEVQLTPDLQEDTDRAVCEMVKAVVGACVNRDEDLYLLRAQNEGVSQPGVNGPWPNSCIIEHPISREYHTTAHANIMAALRQKPFVTLEALDPADDDKVQRVEALCNAEAELFGLEEALSKLVYTCLESRYSVTGVFYKQTRTKQKRLYQSPMPLDGLVALPGYDGSDEGEEPQEQQEQQAPPSLVSEQDITESIEFKHYDPWDFYASPVGVESVGDAEHVFVRQFKTREALLVGVLTEGYDEDAVARIIEGGPTHISDNSPRSDQEALEGIDSGGACGFYECFMVVGRMPYLMDGGVRRVPDKLMHEDFLWMCCPDRGIVFKRTFSPFPIRPFVVGSAIVVPGRMAGHGVVSMLSALQDEMTAIIRALIDSVNMTMNPMLKVPNNLMGHYSKWQSQPGKHLPYMRDPKEVEPLSYDLTGLNLAFELLSLIDGMASRLAAAQGVNSMLGGKQRKAAEVNFTEQVIQNKFALMLMNIQRQVEDIFRIYVATRLYHLQDKISVRGANSAEGTDGAVDVTSDDLQARFQIIPHANADNASAERRMQADAQISAILNASPIFQARMMSGLYDGRYKLDEQMLSHVGIQNPQAFLGPPPTPGSAEAVLTSIVSMLQQAAAKDPVAGMILQRAQTLGQEGTGIAQPQPVAVAGSGLALPAMPGASAAAQGPMGNGAASNGSNGVGGHF